MIVQTRLYRHQASSRVPDPPFSRPVGLRRYFGNPSSALVCNCLKVQGETMAGDLPLRGELRAMLRITMHDSPESVTFLVEGKLVGEWAKELEQCCQHTASIRGHRALIIDRSETLFIDQEGRRVLATLFHQGAFFRTACPMTESIVSEITRKPNGDGRGVLLQCVLLLLLVVAGAKGAQPPAQNTTQPITQPA